MMVGKTWLRDYERLLVTVDLESSQSCGQLPFFFMQSGTSEHGEMPCIVRVDLPTTIKIRKSLTDLLSEILGAVKSAI